MSKTATAAIDAVWDKLNKAIGGDILSKASESQKMDLEVIPYPSYSLGEATGVWGLPLGKLVHLYGLTGSGKSFLSLLMCKQALDKYPGSEVVIIDTEFAFNKKWAQDLGIDPSRIRLIQETNASQIATMLCGKWNEKGKKSVPGILDLIISGELNVKLIVLDSVADLQPPAEIGRGFDEYEMASLARFLPKFMRVLKPQLARAKVGMIMINHLKVSMTGGPDTYSGGVALKHNCDYVIKIHASTTAENTLLDANERKVGHKILCTVEKSRGGANKRQAEAFINFFKGVVRLGEEVATLGDLYGVVKRPNLQMWEYKDKSIRGKDAFYEFLDNNPKIITQIIEEIKVLQASGAEITPVISSEFVSEGEDTAIDS